MLGSLTLQDPPFDPPNAWVGDPLHSHHIVGDDGLPAMYQLVRNGSSIVESDALSISGGFVREIPAEYNLRIHGYESILTGPDGATVHVSGDDHAISQVSIPDPVHTGLSHGQTSGIVTGPVGATVHVSGDDHAISQVSIPDLVHTGLDSQAIGLESEPVHDELVSVTDQTLELEAEPIQNVELMSVTDRAIDLRSVSEPVVEDDAVAEGPENIECSGCFWCENFKGF